MWEESAGGIRVTTAGILELTANPAWDLEKASQWDNNDHL